MVRAVACVALLIAGLGAGCLSSGSVTCEDGRLCPAGTVCDDTHAKCLLPAQQHACDGLAAMASCTVVTGGDGVCVDGWCLKRGCGDTIVEGTEQCDGTAFAPGVSCTSIGYYQDGALACTANCTLDPVGCVGTCGDGVINGTEDCEGGTVPDGKTCADAGFYGGGPLACDPVHCRFITDACTGSCGDGTVNGPELCDGAWTSPQQCVDFGFDAGAMACAPSQCLPDLDACAQLGWHRVPGAPAGKFSGIGGSSPDDVWMVGGKLAYHWDGLAWTATTPDTGGFTINAVWAASPNDAWLVCDGGWISHWNGAAWIAETSPVAGASLRAVSGSSPDDVWAVGLGGVVIHRDAAGWHVMSGYGAADLVSVWDHAGDVWIAGAGGAIYDNGAPVDAGTTSDLVAVWSSGPDDVWIAESGSQVDHFDGLRWSPSQDGLPSHIALSGNDAHDVWVTDAQNDVAHWDGHLWYAGADLGLGKAVALWPAGGGEVWSAGNGAERYPGRGWIYPLGAGVGDNGYVGLAGTGPDALFASTPTGALLAYSGGPGWSQIGASTFTRGWGTGPDDMFFVDGAGIAHWDGLSVTDVVTTETLNGVWGSSPDDVWAVGSTALHYNGVKWLNVGGLGFVAEDVWGWGPDDVWAVGDTGGIAHFTAGAWAAVATPTTQVLHGVWGAGPRDVWAVGDAGTIVHYDGQAWTVVAAPSITASITHVTGTAPDDVWAANDFGAIFHYDGVAWTPVRADAINGGTGTPLSIWAVPRHLLVTGNGISELDRARPWSCRAHETACADEVDDDCDGLIDARDPDCADAVRLSQIAGGDEPLIEVVNHTAATVNLSGLHVQYRLGCDLFNRAYVFPADALVPPGQTFRAVLGTDLGERERFLDASFCKAPPSVDGWVALCAGACDTVACSNVIDYVELGSATSPLKCASFTPAPVDTSGAALGDGVSRAAFAGDRQGVASDWTIAPVARH